MRGLLVLFPLISLPCIVFMSLRTEVVYRARDKAIDACYELGDYTIFDASPSWTRMEMDIRKWTFAQFYPELAVKP